MALLSDIITPTNVVAVAPGANGNVLQSNGTAWTSAALSVGISNIVTATGNTTLTSTPTLLRITPTNYGTTVTLPDATTMTVGTGKFAIQNLSEYHVRIANSAGTLLGFVDASQTTQIGLVSNSNSAGTWSLDNFARVGQSALSAVSATTENFTVGGTEPSIIDLDGNRSFMLSRTSANILYGQVYDQSTNTFGAETLIRNTNCGFFAAVRKLSANSVLVVSTTSSSTAMEAVVLSISGTTITVNTATTKTLPSNISTFRFFKAVPAGGFVYGWYASSSSTLHTIAITVSGTTPSIGNADSTFSGTASTPVYAHAISDKVIIYNPADATGAGGFITITVSGTTITRNARVSLGLTTTTASKFYRLTDTTFFFDAYDTASAIGYVGVMSLSGTTITTYVSANLSAAANSSARSAYPISSTKVFFDFSNGSQIYWNILTFTGSAISLGTPLTAAPVPTTSGIIVLSGNDLSLGSSSTWYVADVSGASPTLKSLTNIGVSSVVSLALPNYEGVLEGLITSDLRVTNLGVSGVTYGLYLKNARVLNAMLTVTNPAFFCPESNSKFGWVSTVTNARRQVRKFELV